MLIRKLVIFIFGIIISGPIIADEIALRPDHPNRYVVVKGDTLWDISARFLETPWRWPEVWSFNPQIKNPHLIYPGDVVSLVYDEQGRPMLKVDRGQPTVKLSPKVRATRVDTPIPTIPLNAIQQFLGQPQVISEREINNAAYIVASSEQHLIAGKGDNIYVRGLISNSETNYSVIRIGDPYRNEGAKPDDILGYEAILVADALVEDFGDPATLRIIESSREVIVGDRLLPKQDYGFDQTFIPHPPDNPIEGQIIDVMDGVSRIGQYQTVVINKGERDGIETGHVLAVFQTGAKIRDPRADKSSDIVSLPDVRAGLVMVIRSFDHLSYAMVMESARDMRVYDYVRNP
ncbi:MAG: LysM peptidoglycan-binding domain-containing protein [Gammaproteobacteria bacterium]|nr:LysM peptidoglycan-binding domain-containing protein [Gammaproteobacteria bacterium]